MCRSGQGVVRGIFEQAPAEDLRGLIVWLPMLPGDGLDAAVSQSRVFQDGRVVRGWDPDRRVGDLFAKLLGLTLTAWDVYLVYPRAVMWRGDRPPRPAVWMHQLSEAWGADQRLRLDPHELSQAVKRALGRAP